MSFVAAQISSYSPILSRDMLVDLTVHLRITQAFDVAGLHHSDAQNPGGLPTSSSSTSTSFQPKYDGKGYGLETVQGRDQTGQGMNQGWDKGGFE